MRSIGPGGCAITIGKLEVRNGRICCLSNGSPSTPYSRQRNRDKRTNELLCHTAVTRISFRPLVQASLAAPAEVARLHAFTTTQAGCVSTAEQCPLNNRQGVKDSLKITVNSHILPLTFIVNAAQDGESKGRKELQICSHIHITPARISYLASRFHFYRTSFANKTSA